ncbi:hypothetical protein BCR44DRAFT_1098877 [Catenaria anguillulae PL171]|uniref:Up-regulated during septation-domain-containing protein n=1 Tax=Catenaria anguillulae PL171 TaxID=765915 RepID=A0A1Y2I1F4_9FUNG|nr:hypothetical protein BCR44DRAFT_1098877 [Catenaria anguillulae PL171]
MSSPNPYPYPSPPSKSHPEEHPPRQSHASLQSSQSTVDPVQTIATDIQTLESLIRDYERKLAYESSVRDSARALLARAASNSDKRTAQRQLDFAQQNIKVIATQLDTFMQRQQQARDALQRQYLDQAASVAAGNPPMAGDSVAPPPRGLASFNNPVMTSASVPVASPPLTPYTQRSLGRSATPGSPPPRTMASLQRQQPGSPPQRTMASLGRSNTASRSQPNISSGQGQPLMSPTYPPERGARKGSAPNVLMSNSPRMAGSPSASLERGMGARGREVEALKAQVAELTARNQALESQKSFALPEPDLGTAFRLDPPTNDTATSRSGTTPLDPYLPMLSNLSFMGLVSQVSGLFAPTAPAVDPRTLDASVTDHVWKLEGAIMDLEYAVAECVKTAVHLAKMQGMRSGDQAREEAKGVERTIETLVSLLFVTSGEKESLRIPHGTPKRPRDTTIIDLLREVNAGKPVRRSAFRTSAHPTVQLMPTDEAVQKALEYDALQKREQQRAQELASVQQSHERLERELIETSKQVAGLKDAKLQLEMRVSDMQRRAEGQRDRVQELEAEVGKLRPRVVELENSERELTTQLKSQAALLEEQRREMTNALAASIPRPPAKNTSALNQLLQERDTELSSTRAQLAQAQSNVTQIAKFAEQQKGEYELMLQQVHKEMEVVAQQNEDLSNQIVELRQANSVIAGVAQYQERIGNLETAVGQLQAVVAEKDALLERARDTVEDYRERITVLATQVEAAKKNGQGPLSGLPALGSALSSQQSQPPQVDEGLNAKLAAAEEKVETLSRQAEAARALASKWEVRVRELEGSTAPVTSTANVASTDVQAQVADLESQLAEAKSSIKKKTALINKLKEELERAVDATSPPSTLQRSTSAGRVRQSMMPSRKSVAASSAPEPDLVEMNNTTPPRRRQGSEPNITTPSPNSRMRQSSVPAAGRQSIVSNRQSVSNGKDDAVANLADALRKKTLLVTKLQTEVDDLRAKLSSGSGGSSSRAMGPATAAAIANLTSTNPGDLAKDLEQTREQLEAAREEITSLNQQVATDAATLAEFGAAVKKKSTLVEKLTAKLQALEQEKQTLEKQHTDDFAKIQRLAKMVREYKTQSMTRGAEVEELTAKLANNGQVGGADAQVVERLTAELQRERQVVADREAEIARMNKELQRARSAAMSGGQQQSQSSVSTSELVTELAKSQARIQDLEREINQLRSQPPPAVSSFAPVAPLTAGGSTSATSSGIVFNPSMLGAGLRKNSQPDLSRSIAPAAAENEAARSRSRSVPETQLGQQIDNLNRSRDAFGSSVRQLKDALDDVERATLTQSSRAIGDEALGDDPDVSKLLSENRLLRQQLDSVLNQLAATADIDYLRSQLADMPTKQEIEAMRSTIASQADYTYLRAQLAELPTKAEVDAMRSALAGMVDHEYLIKQLAEAPSSKRSIQCAQCWRRKPIMSTCVPSRLVAHASRGGADAQHDCGDGRP